MYCSNFPNVFVFFYYYNNNNNYYYYYYFVFLSSFEVFLYLLKISLGSCTEMLENFDFQNFGFFCFGFFLYIFFHWPNKGLRGFGRRQSFACWFFFFWFTLLGFVWLLRKLRKRGGCFGSGFCFLGFHMTNYIFKNFF